MEISAIDLFCGIGGLSYGLKKAGIKVVVGVDIDATCKFAFEENVGSSFLSMSVSDLTGKKIKRDYWSNKEQVKVLVGCAPCQPFSTHSNKNLAKKQSEKWNLLNEFKRLIEETAPKVISMENVPNLANQEIFRDFVDFLISKRYNVSYSNVYCPDYGIPQKRRRLVLLASKFGEIKIIPKTHSPANYTTLKMAIGHLPFVPHGSVSKTDPLHKTIKLSEINLKRIKASKPKGTWADWDENLRLACHKKESGSSYSSVYGRMSWEEPSSTITTQFYNYGTGRFGHPTQNRALTLREGAILQTFPSHYKFFQEESEVSLSQLGTHIGNAVPVDLGFVIGKTIKQHINCYYDTKAKEKKHKENSGKKESR